eukprot:766723-Hanusia_phi.AAC.1
MFACLRIAELNVLIPHHCTQDDIHSYGGGAGGGGGGEAAAQPESQCLSSQHSSVHHQHSLNILSKRNILHISSLTLEIPLCQCIVVISKKPAAAVLGCTPHLERTIVSCYSKRLSLSTQTQAPYRYFVSLEDLTALPRLYLPDAYCPVPRPRHDPLAVS